MRTQTESNILMSSKLNEFSMELDRFKQENQELCSKIIELEMQIDTQLLTIKQQERAAQTDKEEV